ncbi:MAG: hypothetical protein JSS02_21630, partial [Planctomycetes bacterium]|nr:hypothetical protein [Planctomycetota bacterium]
MKRVARCCSLFLLFAFSAHAVSAADPLPIRDKTLVAWVTPANLTQSGGSVLSLEKSGGVFDAVVFAELTPATWMPGSDGFRRTKKEQADFPRETAAGTTLVQVAIVYRDRQVSLYRNGVLATSYTAEGAEAFYTNSTVLIGQRHLGVKGFFAGQIDDARIYNLALSAEQLKSLKPNQPSDPQPLGWWSFEQGSLKDAMGRFPDGKLVGKARIADGQLVLDGQGSFFLARSVSAALPPADRVLNFHLMHPGGESLPGDPNAAFCLNGTYHLHYILAHPWQGQQSFSFVHVTSPDMLHWTWQTTKLQPAFTGHGMFSGTGFLTKDGKPAAIYHGQGSGRNQIAIAKDSQISAWEKPYPVDVRNADGSPAQINHWDPDCFLIGDTYYAISGGENPPLMKSKDLRTWTKVGPFLQRDLPDVAKGEDVSCANFFPIDGRWMLLCISHHLGCRYYIGDWDAKAEQFVPTRHGRMNWRRESQSLFGTGSWRVDFFAPESVLTPDGRRVMWAWLASVDRNDGTMSRLTMQSLPRELEVPADGTLRIRPLRELEKQRRQPVVQENVVIKDVAADLPAQRSPVGTKLADLPGESVELRLTIPRAEANRKLFGLTL